MYKSDLLRNKHGKERSNNLQSSNHHKLQTGEEAEKFSSWSFTNIYFLDNMAEKHGEDNDDND